MTTPDIDFVRDRERRMAWVAMGIMVVAVVLALGSYRWYRSEQRRTDASILELQRQLSASQNTPSAPTAASMPAWTKEADASVKEDWNRLFDRLEGLKVQGVRLASVQAGLHPRTVRVEFDLDAWPRIAELNAELNQGAQDERWNLLSASASSGGGMVRAVWSSDLP